MLISNGLFTKSNLPWCTSFDTCGFASGFIINNFSGVKAAKITKDIDFQLYYIGFLLINMSALLVKRVCYRRINYLLAVVFYNIMTVKNTRNVFVNFLELSD